MALQTISVFVRHNYRVCLTWNLLISINTYISLFSLHPRDVTTIWLYIHKSCSIVFYRQARNSFHICIHTYRNTQHMQQQANVTESMDSYMKIMFNTMLLYILFYTCCDLCVWTLNERTKLYLWWFGLCTCMHVCVCVCVYGLFKRSGFHGDLFTVAINNTNVIQTIHTHTCTP